MQDDQQSIGMPLQPQLQSITQLPQTDQKIKELIRKKFLESQQLQQQEIEQAKQRLAIEQAKQAEAGVLGNLDLRPFAEAARQYGATTAVVPKEAPESNAALLEKLRQEVVKNQQGMTDDQINFLRTMMEDRKNAQAALSQGNQDLRIRSLVNSSEQAKKIRNIGTLSTKLKNLEGLVNSVGAEITGADKAKLESAFKDAEVAWKEAANLGALQGPDIEMIRGALGQSPTTGKGLFGYALSGGKEGLLNKIRGARERAITEGQGHLENVMSVYPYPVADPIFKDLSKKLELKPAESEAKVKTSISSKDIDKMSKEELKKFLGE